MMTRRQLADRATVLAGGVPGWSIAHDPEGYFEYVTEGRQRVVNAARAAWRKKPPATRGKEPLPYSACEDLAVCLAVEACGDARPLPWANRKDAGNSWQPGQNLLRIKMRAKHAWRDWAPRKPWLAKLGDAVQTQGRLAHTFILTEIRYAEDGSPVSVDLAEYGQYHDADGPGPAPAADSCRCRSRVPVSRDSAGRWCIGSSWVIGHLDIIALAESEIAKQSTLPLTPPDDTAPVRRTLRQGSTGDDVRQVQRIVGVTVDGSYGPLTAAAVAGWQRARGLVGDGVWGPVSWTTYDRGGQP